MEHIDIISADAGPEGLSDIAGGIQHCSRAGRS
jgi:hypothetical protein